MSIPVNKSIGGGDMTLSLTGMRIAPRDPSTHNAKVGVKQEVYRPERSMASLQPRIMKERSGYSGGFKIPEEYRKSKIKKKGLLSDTEQEEDLDGTQQSQITKDEIFQQLNLGHADLIGVGKHGTNSKAALAKDLVEGIEKDLEKLKRQHDNINLRKQLALTGQSIVEETEEEKNREMEAKLRFELETAGTHVIAASPRKLQVMRHQASQLASIKNLELEELEQMRAENEQRLKQLEQVYMSKRENASVGRIIRDKMGYSMNDKRSNSGGSPRPDFERAATHNDYDYMDKEDDEAMAMSHKKKKKSVRIAGIDDKENHLKHRDDSDDMRTAQFGLNAKGPDSRKDTRVGRAPATVGASGSFKGASRLASRKKQESPLQYDSPRRKLYEAKFEKFITNKQQKVKQEKKLEKMQKEDFDRYTKGPDSPAKSSNRFMAKALQQSAGRYEPDSLIPKDYDERKLVEQQMKEHRSPQRSKGDPFAKLGVSNEDKMTFFLLKWIFNAIKRDSSEDDPKLKGKAYVTKADLVKQLGKNKELMDALGYYSIDQIQTAMRSLGGVKDGCLIWDEFLDFFFLRQASLQERLDADTWWRKIGNSEQKDNQLQMLGSEPTDRDAKGAPAPGQGVPRYPGQGPLAPNVPYNYEDPDKKPVKMTESLRLLQDTRQRKLVDDVEEEFKAIQDKKQQEQKAAMKTGASIQQAAGAIKKKTPGQGGVTWDAMGYDDEEELLEEQFGIKREKSQCLLLKSQIFIMEEIFKALDKYDDGILRRGQYIMALRTDERVVEFIDADAVKVPYSNRVLTLDEVLVEIEKDEMYEMTQMGKNSNQINHKEFLTWREYMSYFNDYRDIEERNRKTKEIQRTRQSLQKERAGAAGADQATEGGSLEISSLMEKEKLRRLQEMPKLRPADQIDITEKQLQLLRDIYDQLPKVPGLKDTINTIDFFIATRKNPQLRAISSAIARDPEGYSRIPRETFQQVFDRMENEIQAKQIEWATIVEYFTKRGRPLTKEEITKLIEDDRRQREEEEQKKRNEEEAERRRMARLMEDLEEKEDFEEFEMRQKSEQAAKILEERQFESKQSKRGKKRAVGFAGEDDEDLYGEENDEDQDDDEDAYGDEDDIDRERQYEDEDGGHGGGGYMSDPELRTAQRSYKFGGGDGPKGYHSQRKKERAQSAKGRGRSSSKYEEKDLRSMKLTTKDYIEHNERSQSRKRGKYGITVPKPFNFDIREKTRTKTIREKKIEEMIAEKKMKEENLLKYQFRPNPIPPEVLIPRYKTIIEGNEMRRLEVKKNSIAITKAREKPFSFYERDKHKQQLNQEEYLPMDLKQPTFKANPIPRACSVLIFDQMMKQQEQERQERIRKQAELNFSKAKLPDRMQMHSEKLKQMPSQKSEADFYSFKPRINELVTREQFKKQQDKFNQKLNKKKSQMQVTRPKSPNFTKTSSKGLDREYLNEGQQSATTQGPMDKFKAALMKNVSKAAASAEDKAAQNPSSTVSMNLAMQKRREELEAKRKAEEQKKKEDEQRLAMQNRVSH